jgi:hypothetical protein
MKRGTTIHLRGQDARNFMKAVRESVGDEEDSQGKRHVPLALALTANRKELLTQVDKLQAIANAADVMMHHFADAHWQEASFGKMIEAMEPLRLALVAAGYGLPKSEMPS